MLRILRSDFHRLFHSVAFYSIPLILIVSMIITVLGTQGESPEVTLAEVLADANMMMSAITFLISNIVAVSIWNSEHKHGYIKNLAGIVSGRHIPVLSKIIYGIVICLVYVLFTLVYVFGSAVFTGQKITGSALDGQVKGLILLTAAGIASMVVMLALYELFHSSAVCYIVAIMLWTNMLENLIVQVTYLAFKWENTGRYMLIMGLNWENTGTCENVIRILLYMIASAGVAVFLARKQDIKA